MDGVSMMAATAHEAFSGTESRVLYMGKQAETEFKIMLTNDSLWIITEKAGFPVNFRAAFFAGGKCNVQSFIKDLNGLHFILDTDIGWLYTSIQLPGKRAGILRYTTSIKPKMNLLMPYCPRDVLFPVKTGEPGNVSGKIHFKQTGTRSGMIYCSLTRPMRGSILYFQNLTALNEYCEQTKTSLCETVGGEWPELGFALPPSGNHYLEKGKRWLLSDAFVAFSGTVPGNESSMVNQFLEMLGDIYLQLPRPETKCHDWPAILDKGLADLIDSKGCWSQNAGQQYFNAYVCDYTTPPEVMVQLAVLLPLVDYMEWRGETMEVKQTILKGLEAFYNAKLRTIMRWLPAAQDQLTGDEEQKQPMVMDSWYLHHPLLNLSRMALKGDRICKELFLNSLEFAVKVAHHFKYDWPVFYHMETLETVKAETEPGKGGEQDVAGLYAHVMIQAYELTKDKRYLREAERSAKTLAGKGFQLLYQANNTAFGAGALLRLWKLTGKKIYLELSNLCMANLFKNVQLWDCNYGFAKSFPTFFALFPLSNAPYTAVYEEQEVFCAFHDYLQHAEGEEILPALRLLLPEYIRYLIYRAVYYYPAMLPKEMLEEKPKTGELDPKLWIALEDLHDGWEKSGQVGQEVYGAGNAFGIVPRHYIKVRGKEYYVFADYPVSEFKQRGNKIYLQLAGDARMTAKISLVPIGQKRIPSMILHVGKSFRPLPEKINSLKHKEYTVPGNARVTISPKLRS